MFGTLNENYKTSRFLLFTVMTVGSYYTKLAAGRRGGVHYFSDRVIFDAKLIWGGFMQHINQFYSIALTVLFLV